MKLLDFPNLPQREMHGFHGNCRFAVNSDDVTQWRHLDLSRVNNAKIAAVHCAGDAFLKTLKLNMVL